MVNLVVRHGSQGNIGSPVLKSPSAIANRISKLVPASTNAASPSAASERIIPSPIRVPYLRDNNGGVGTHRPVSPLTASESMFGVKHETWKVNNRGLPGDSEIRQQPSEGSINSNTELVCDYDQSITPLYEMLESSQWDKARARCHTHPQEVHTWIVRRDANDNIRWKLLPLHAAVIFQAPMPVVEAMLIEYPIAAAKRDDQGMLPVHLAFRHKSEEVLIERMIRQYPGGLTVKDLRDRLPLDHAKENQFSYRMMKLYSETYALCHRATSESSDANKSMSTHEKTRLDTIKEAYEARIKDMIKEHEHALQQLNSKNEKEAQATQALHNAEMDELRDLLSREVSSGQKVSQLEEEMRRLRESLEEANQEGTVLRRVVHEQKSQQEALVEQLHQILKEQKSLHDYCLQQQEQLDQAHQLREQLLRTLLQKEDGKDLRVSTDVCQLSNKLLSRMETLLKDASLGQLDTESDLRRITNNNGDGMIGAVAAAVAATTMAETTPATNWGELSDHGDDISAITENSNF
ncbi:hypothetical protein IV203_008811 [Nitzschia inconspicua]|uniref:Uncharacterized protein n=1 Tax=Nitzschia inconspicua TaxID=303405 RepID=A0A9K3KZE5_9STRA|nr:hypothetical protein IV203_008811 [Nitzschia inconspicua]